MMIFSIVFSAVIIISMILIFSMSSMFNFVGIGDKTIQYINEPFKITASSSTATIESIEITSVEDSTIKLWIINFKIIGIVEGSNFLNIEVKCYDKNDFYIGSESLRMSSSITDSEKFKVEASIWAPEKTTRIEFVKD